MKAIYTVTNIEEDFITVAEQNPLNPEKNIVEFNIKNLRNFDLHLGSHVYIGFPKKLEALYGILGLFFPVAAAAAGLFLAEPICHLIKTEPSEFLKALSILLTFAVASAIVFTCSRKLPVKMQIQITGVID